MAHHFQPGLTQTFPESNSNTLHPRTVPHTVQKLATKPVAVRKDIPLPSPPSGEDMSNFGIEITGMVIKETIRQILEEYVKNERYRNHRPSQQHSILERRCGPARGTAYRTLPDPNPHQRRKTDFGSKSKAA